MINTVPKGDRSLPFAKTFVNKTFNEAKKKIQIDSFKIDSKLQFKRHQNQLVIL